MGEKMPPQKERGKLKKETTALWVSTYPEVKRWLAKLQVKEQNVRSLYHFCEWAGKSPTELLALKDNPASKEAEKLLDDFVAADIPGFTNAIKFHCATAVKSFFKWNYRDLAKASGAITLEKLTPYHKLSKESLRKLWTWAPNQRDKALITFVCSTAIAKETLTELKWSHLEEGWENRDLPALNIESELLKGHGQGKYKGVRQITFLTSEAKRDLINYKEWMEQKLGRKLTPEDNIWLETRARYKPLRYRMFGILIWDLSRRSGVQFSWHDARRWVNTALEQIAISPNWARKIRGRKIRGEEAPYSQPAIEQLRAKFREAVPLLEFTSEVPAVSKEVEERLKALETFKKTLTPEQIEAGRRAGYQFRKKVSEPPKDEECPDGKQCETQRVVAEAELPKFLDEGWQVVTALASGSVVIRQS